MKKLLLSLICLSVSCYFLPTTQAQQLDNTMWGTNGRVEAIAKSGNTIYIGGLFTRVGPNTGSAVLLNGADGKVAESPQLQVVGPVHTIVPDGKGGWYMGGGFTRVQQLPRRGLAHILPDGSVDPNWSPTVNGTQGVFALAVDGNRVYAGGTFDTISGQYRENIAALDATTGQLTPWNPGALGSVFSLAVSGNLVYAGGNFFNIGRRAVTYFAAVDAVTGRAAAWSPGVSGEVQALAIAGNTLYVGGSFTTVRQQVRANLAAFDLVTRELTAWNPGTNGSVQTLKVSGNTLYAGGFFSTIGGQSRSMIAALDVTTGQLTPWNPQLRGKAGSVPGSHVTALAIAGNKVYASGNFTWVGTQPRDYLAAIDAESGLALPDWIVPVNDLVTALGSVGERLLVGGRFNSVGAQSRKNIAALNATTGQVIPWNPGTDARVYALAASGNTVYAGGAFNSIGGQSRRYVAALDGTTGQVTPWNVNADFMVTTLAVAGRTVYAGGSFGSIGGRGQPYVAALDATTGKATAWNPQVNGTVDALAVTDRVIYIGGRFTTADGQTRNRIAALNAVTGWVTPWNPNADAQVLALAFADNTVYAGGHFSTIGGQNRSRIAALDAATGQATSWNPQLYDYYGKANYTYTAGLAVTGPTVYAGGQFHSINRQARKSLAAIAADGSGVTAWNPGLLRYLHANADVKALLIQDGQLHVGGEFSEAEGRFVANFAVFGKKVPAPNLITGVVYEDQNGNCNQDAGEKGIANAVIVAQPGNYFASSDSTGKYTLAVDTGSYTVGQMIGPEDSRFIKQLCPANPPTHPVRFTGAGQTSSAHNFANRIDRRSNLSVQVASDRRRRCFTGLTTINYCNKGFGAAANAKLYVKLPEHVVPVRASSKYTLDQDKNLVFDLGTLAPDTCGTLYLTDSVVCNNPNIRGRTQCTRAWITPANSRTPGPEWDQSDITLKARCLINGRVRLGIYNTGTGNMTDSSAYRVYLDAQLAFTRSLKLAKGDSLILQVPANGRTVRLEADQRPGHPTKQSTSVTLEACGTNADGKVSLGFVAQLPSDDAEPEIAVECLPIIDSYDPNDKAVSPGGVTDQHYTPTGSRLDYVIRFQNTGTDVAYKVVVVDTLSADLDVSTLQLGSVSHPYKMQVSGKGRPVLTFTFHNIMLPDSNANEPKSHGYLQFSIKPRTGLPEKTRIENFADIFFDYNEPVRTNTTFNTLHDLPPVPSEAFKLDTTVVCTTTNTTVTAGSHRIVCVQDTVVLAAVQPAHGNGRWQRVGGKATVTDPRNPASGVTGLAYGDNVFQWRVAANTCGTDSLAAQLTITRLRRPTPPTITGRGADSLACSTAAGDYQWYRDGNPLGLQTQVIQAIQPGLYTVRVMGEAGCHSDLSPAFAWLPTAAEPDLVLEIRVYPNPTTGEFVVVLPPDITQSAQLTLSDAVGRIVTLRTLPPGMSRERTVRFDVATQPKGVYLLKLQTDKVVVVRKVCRQ